MKPVFDVDFTEIEKTLWFDVEILSTKEGDFFYKKSVDYNKKSIHPAQKPINIYNLLLTDFAEKGMKILDTHLGSGNSRISSYFFGCDFVGFETNIEYCQKMNKKFNETISQQRLF
jgi:site-specific DNA-methyltransferase (adenine-specific)